MRVMEKVGMILKLGYVCDHCLGRQFAQLLEGYSNDERGRLLRKVFLMSADAQRKIDIDRANITEQFHSETLKKTIKPSKKHAKCIVCGGLFENLDKWIGKIRKALGGIEFDTFLIGTKLNADLIGREEWLWEKVGIDYCEPIKAEINREIGKRIEKELGKKADLKSPDVNIIINFSTGRVKVEKNPLFIYGEYQKLRRGIPQTIWPSGKYKTSVQQIIAKPVMSATRGEWHKFHGAGREDIDARCLGWRPFVLEITEPKKRHIDLDTLEKKINKSKSVRVRHLRFSSIDEVRQLKSAKPVKTYAALVKTNKDITRKDLKKLNNLVGEIRQWTPLRVSHRRSNRCRKRKVLSLKVRYINKRTFLLTVRTEAGTYIKELISGDSGRTKPSVAEILGVQCVCKQLDVTKIDKIK